MYTVNKHFEVSYAHRLYKYPGQCGNIHGHTARVEVLCSVKDLPETGMAIDFRELKNKIGPWLKDNFDHRLLLWQEDPIVNALKEMGEDVVVLKTQPSAENIAKIVFEKVAEMNFPVTKVLFWESPTSIATYEA